MPRKPAEPKLNLDMVHVYRSNYVNAITELITKGELIRGSTREELYGLLCALFQVAVPLVNGLSLTFGDAVELFRSVFSTSRPPEWAKTKGIVN